MDYIEEIRAEMRRNAKRFAIQLALMLTAAVSTGVAGAIYLGRYGTPAVPAQQQPQ